MSEKLIYEFIAFILLTGFMFLVWKYIRIAFLISTLYLIYVINFFFSLLNGDFPFYPYFQLFCLILVTFLVVDIVFRYKKRNESNK